jgi:Flp pilus assembly protein TadD
MSAHQRDATPTVAELLGRVDALLSDGDLERALASLSAVEHPLLLNARGVCLLRLGQKRKAVELFSRLVFQGDSLSLVEGVPTELVTNLATALLLEDNLVGCRTLLDRADAPSHPEVVRIRSAIERWRQGLGWWQRVQYAMYGSAGHPVELDGPPGVLVWPEGAAPRRSA